MKPGLTDAELDELDALLERTPEPLEPPDLSMLEGYLCGVIVQPRLVGVDEWLPGLFDLDGGALPDDVDAEWLGRCRALIERHHAALNAQLAEEGWFDPLVADPDRQPPASEYEPAHSPYSRALLGWAAGFEWAQSRFPELVALDEPAVQAALARLYRHLPVEDDAARDAIRRLDAELPLPTFDAALVDLVDAVAALWELTYDDRYRVAPVRRDAPKVGRNDPCPCGSGKKYKQCHGRGA